MKINKKIVQEVLKNEFGVIKADVVEKDSYYKVCYKAVPGKKLEYEAYYVEHQASSFLDVYVGGLIVAGYEFVRDEGKNQIKKREEFK